MLVTIQICQYFHECGIIYEIGKVTPQYSFLFKWAMIQSYYEQTTITKEACGSV